MGYEIMAMILDESPTGTYDRTYIPELGFAVATPSPDIAGLEPYTPSVDVGPAIPPKIIDLITQAPIVSQVGLVTDFWKLVIGTPGEKVETVAPYLPVDEGGQTVLIDVVEKMEAADTTGWTTQNYLTIPGAEPTVINFPELPDLGDIGKWLLIGAIAIGGLFLLGKYVGRKK